MRMRIALARNVSVLRLASSPSQFSLFVSSNSELEASADDFVASSEISSLLDTVFTSSLSLTVSVAASMASV